MQIKNILTSISLGACLALLLSLAVMTTGCAGDQYHRSTGTYIDDTAVSAKIKTDLIADANVKAAEVQVRTYEGQVQLSGFVDTLDQKTRAAEIARRVDGVKYVRNDLVIKIGAPSAAGQIEEPAGAGK
jgi:hyperosmotically inducible protein